MDDAFVIGQRYSISVHANPARFSTQMGEERLALDTLRSAVMAGWVDYEWIERDTDLDPIRQHPEYAELLKGK